MLVFLVISETDDLQWRIRQAVWVRDVVMIAVAVRPHYFQRNRAGNHLLQTAALLAVLASSGISNNLDIPAKHCTTRRRISVSIRIFGVERWPQSLPG